MSERADGSFTIDLEPVGQRVRISRGETLLDAARVAGVGIITLCGGEGWCESCQVRVVSGACQPPTEAESAFFTEEMLRQGHRLACQAVPTSDVKVYLLPESLSAPQRLQIEGEETPVELDPAVWAVGISLTPPSLADSQSDTQRLRGRLAEIGYTGVQIGFPLLKTLSNQLRAQGWQARLALYGDELVALLPTGARLLGFAIDIGTTKLAAYLVDLESGAILAKSGAMNPQISIGEDVISRLTYAQQGAEATRQLQTCLMEALNELLGELCAEYNFPTGWVVHTVVVGNTVMHHLFAELPVGQLALAPYVPALSETISIQAGRLGLNMAPSGPVTLLPNIGGYVGADHSAVLLATQLWKAEHPTMVIDIGTNTEISLAAGGKLYSCSCASGPAFEGAHIRKGMRAAPGAIERFQIIDGSFYTYTIGGQAPLGICGSGIVDVVAELRRAGILDEKGAVLPVHACVRATNMGNEIVIVAAEQSGHGQEITLRRQDINEIQMAKAAIHAGIEILLETAGIEAQDLQNCIIAGAFGTYINPESAVQIGLLPNLPLERFRQIGNAAGIGARKALMSAKSLSEIEAVSRSVQYVELSLHPQFQQKFLRAMYL